MIVVLIVLAVLAASGIIAAVAALTRDGHRRLPATDPAAGTWAQRTSASDVNASS